MYDHARDQPCACDALVHSKTAATPFPSPFQFGPIAPFRPMSLAVVAGMNGLATSQYAKADSLEMSRYGQSHVAVQRVTVVGHRATA